MNNTTSTDTTRSVLRTLRSLMPVRDLTMSEALQIAERQATKLLMLHDITAPGVPIEIITEQPRIRISQSYDIPASGSAHWDGQDWIITVNAAEYDLRQRYTICHEYKHLLDHPVRHRRLRLPASSTLTQADAIERVADYFAACVLMPRAWIKDAFCNQHIQRIEDLATRFAVSPKAMSYRLRDLGLIARPERCAPRKTLPIHQTDGRGRAVRYHRAFSTSLIATRGVPV